MLEKNASMKSKQEWSTINLLHWALLFLLFATLICIFVPFIPVMPSESLDPSWKIGLNQALAQKLAFGRDIIFTFGPFASIYTKTYHPASYSMMMIGSTYLGLTYAATLCVMGRNRSWYWILFFILFFGGLGLKGLIFKEDALLYSYPLLVAICCFKLIDLKTTEQKWFFCSLLSLLFFPFGLLFLIKSSFLFLGISIITLTFILFMAEKRWPQAIIVVLVPSGAVMSLWILSGQNPINLPYYLLNEIPIISGYTEAMSSIGNFAEIMLYLVTATILLVVLLHEKNISPRSKLYLLLSFGVYQFVAFKSGFVRHDAHARISASSILITALLLSLIVNPKKCFIVLLASFLTFIYIESHYDPISIYGMINNIKSLYLNVWNRPTPSELNNEFHKTIQNLANKIKFPEFKGSTDIYSHNQTYLIASKNTWNPRPIFQSYAAYTPKLIQKNEAHLLGEHAPDNIIFSVEPIDDRLPSIEDGSSWPILLSLYQPSAMVNNFLYLHKVSHLKSPKNVSLKTGNYSLGEKVLVPNTSSLVFAKISITPTLLGKLMKVLYKPSQLHITLNLIDGTTQTYRIISEMVNTNFLISPLIQNTNEFSLMYSRLDFLSNKKVKSFSINSIGSQTQWSHTYTVEFNKLANQPKIDISKLHRSPH